MIELTNVVATVERANLFTIGLKMDEINPVDLVTYSRIDFEEFEPISIGDSFTVDIKNGESLILSNVRGFRT